MTPKLTALFQEYADDHRHPTNQLTHKIAIPLVVFHIIAMLNCVELVSLPLAWGTPWPAVLAAHTSIAG